MTVFFSFFLIHIGENTITYFECNINSFSGLLSTLKESLIKLLTNYLKIGGLIWWAHIRR